MQHHKAHPYTSPRAATLCAACAPTSRPRTTLRGPLRRKVHFCSPYAQARRDGDELVRVLPRWRDGDDLVDGLLDVLNGDWRAPFVQHYCWQDGCCPGGQRSCVELVCSIIERAVFDGLSQEVPSVTRWHTFDEAVELGALGMLLHSILSRVMLRASLALGPPPPENPQAQPEGAQEESSWAAFCDKKAQMATAFLSTPGVCSDLSIAAVVSEPVSHLTSCLQHLDETGNGLLELLSHGMGALGSCERHLFLLTQTAEHPQQKSRVLAGMEMLLHSISDHQAVLDRVFCTALAIGSQVWARIHVPLTTWPLRFSLNVYGRCCCCCYPAG